MNQPTHRGCAAVAFATLLMVVACDESSSPPDNGLRGDAGAQDSRIDSFTVVDGSLSDGPTTDVDSSADLGSHQDGSPDQRIVVCIDGDDDGFGQGIDCDGPDCDDTNKACHAGLCCAADPVSVGAIRWDAWFGDMQYPSNRWGVHGELQLGPEKWRDRLPFSGQVLSPTEVQARCITQQCVDQEILHARGALDYWATLLYPRDNALSRALDRYLTSPYKSEVGLAVIVDEHQATGGPSAWASEQQRIITLIQEPSYFKVLGNRPLVYLFRLPGWVSSERFQNVTELQRAIASLRQECISKGLGNPYFVSLHYNASTAASYADSVGAQAVSAYALQGVVLGHSAGHKTYAELTTAVEAQWDIYSATKEPVVPLCMAGWDTRPRGEMPFDVAPWLEIDPTDYYEQGSPEAIATHVQKAIRWSAARSVTGEAKTVLIYAWNEHTEGGWLAPTYPADDARLRTIEAMRYGTLPTAHHLKAHWHLDGHLLDASRYNSDAFREGTLSFAAGIRGRAVQLDGSGSHVVVADRATLEGMASLTLSVWLRLDQLPANFVVPLTKEGAYRFVVDSAGGVHFAMATTNNGWYSTGTVASCGDLKVAAGIWAHLGGTYDGQKVRCYLDGTLGGETTGVSGPIASNDDNLTWGKRIAAGNNLTGCLDEVRIYDHALSTVEIEALFDARE